MPTRLTTQAIFSQSFESASGTLELPTTGLISTSVDVLIVGEGGAGGATDTTGTQGGAGGGGGGVVYGSINVQAGDTFTVSHTPANTRSTVPGTAQPDGGSMTVVHDRTNTTWTANGGKSGGLGATGGAGGGGTGTGATIQTGGAGGAAGADGTAPGSQPAGQKGTDGTSSTAGKATKAGGGGGAPHTLPSWATTALADNSGVTFKGLNGGSGGSSTANDPPSNDQTRSSLYISVDGEDGKREVNLEDGGLDVIGAGGGGAGQGHTDNSSNPSLGGAGGQAICMIQYEFDSYGPEITLTGKYTEADPYIVEAGGTFIEPGFTCTDYEGNQVAVTTTLPTELEAPISGTIGQTYAVTYTSDPDELDVVGTAERYVRIQDTTAPVIQLKGEAVQDLLLDATYVEFGAEATDNDGTTYDENSSAMVIDSSSVDTSTLGSYSVTYNLTDAAGNQSDQVTRTVRVVTTLSNNANNSGPVSTPRTGEISFSQIIASSQMWRESSTKSSLNHVDANKRILKDVSINDLRNWYIKYGLGTNTTHTDATNPGARANSTLASSSTNESQVRTTQFRNFSPLTLKMRAKPETFETYRNYNDAAISIVPWGATQGTNRNIYTVTLDPTKEGYAGSSQTNRGTGAAATFTGLNRGGTEKSNANSSVTTSQGTNKRDNTVNYDYDITVSFKHNTTGTGTVTYDAVQITLGQSGTTSTTCKLGGSTSSTAFMWGSSTTSNASYSNWLRHHVGFSSPER